MSQNISFNRERLKTPRAAAIAGILFSLLLILSLILIRITIPFDPFENGEWLQNNGKNVSLALTLIPFSGIAFLWFMGVVRDRFGEMEDKLFATVFLGSGFLFLVLLFISAGIGGSVVLLYGNTPSNLVGDEFYPFGRALMYTIANVYAVKMASVFLITTTTLSFRIGIFPKWFIYLSYGLGLIMLLNLFFVEWLILIFPVWVLLISVIVLVENYRVEKEAGSKPAS
ncbi:MAG: hypothetical protein HGA28_00335 [Anaerolineaceae bacterium]|nr:hypothetical protein [Anaerolineaceae bacterium]